MEHQYLANLKIKSFNTKILMLIPKGEHHTYGGIAATRKLRGLGTEPFLTLDYKKEELEDLLYNCLLYTSPSPRDRQKSRMPSSA